MHLKLLRRSNSSVFPVPVCALRQHVAFSDVYSRALTEPVTLRILPSAVPVDDPTAEVVEADKTTGVQVQKCPLPQSSTLALNVVRLDVCWVRCLHPNSPSPQVFVDLIGQAPVTAKESLLGIKFLCEQSSYHAQVRMERGARRRGGGLVGWEKWVQAI
jgi:hypothetical protein